MINKILEQDLETLKQAVKYYSVIADSIFNFCLTPIMCNIANVNKRHWTQLKRYAIKCQKISEYLHIILKIFNNIDTNNKNLLDEISKNKINTPFPQYKKIYTPSEYFL